MLVALTCLSVSCLGVCKISVYASNCLLYGLYFMDLVEVCGMAF